MVRTQVGYAGGEKQNPTYYSLGDHAETIEIGYDPDQISYEELLAVFWDSHNASSRPFSTQYRSIIFYHDEVQREAAEASLAAQEAESGRVIYTEIVAASDFYPAEAYHQKYRLRQEPRLLSEYQAIYPDPADLVSSTAVARVNGYLAGHGSEARLQSELGSLGLSPAGQALLMERVSIYGP